MSPSTPDHLPVMTPTMTETPTTASYWVHRLGRRLYSRKSQLLDSCRSRHYNTIQEEHYQHHVYHRVPSPQAQDLLRVKTNEHGQLQCRGCDQITYLLRWAEAERRKDPSHKGTSPKRIIHNSYIELDMCARISNCDACQVVRRALLLDQITGRDAERLRDMDKQWPVHVALDIRPGGESLLVTIEKPSGILLFSATVVLSQKPCLAVGKKTKGPSPASMLRPNFEELRQVVTNCHENHQCSSRYRWNSRNPSWLLKILPDGKVQVIPGPSDLVDYVVLSYSWGDPTAMPAEEWARIKGAATKTINGVPVAERTNPFARSLLPETMQDAIAITQELHYKYIWIDSVCIPKGTDWDTEASLMHEVYGNAAFTLLASSSTKATEPMLHDRLAWLQEPKPCKLRNHFLCNTQKPLHEVRLDPPASQRAWTLQEERLSPRILYWTGQRWYWSCPEHQTVESSPLDLPSPVCASEDQSWSPPQRFLDVCRIGDFQSIDQEWLDIVEAYTRRDLAHSADRFLAISGLAVRFLEAKMDGGGKTRVSEEYLAGLWREDLARHLSWSVASSVDPGGSHQDVAPSWSWASLPLCVNTKMRHAFKQSPYFQFVGVRQFSSDYTLIIPTATPNQQVGTNPRLRSKLAEQQGRTVKQIEIQGRFRRFISEHSRDVPWEEIEWQRGDRVGFNFEKYPGQDLHSRNYDDGRIVSKDAHGGEVVGQLDYLLPAGGYFGDKKGDSVALADGDETELMCLELGELAMLLLQRNPGPEETWRRVGVCIGYEQRKGFFYGCESRTVVLA
ncbi:heterokaryon incompatibility protein-domain-containing protein [Pseudoneurospora amorphoporcata]|uniref:Heterokaryon incompatibility protein-domain-containing protein n=1 Tax=Pseudoneurospora amorphoporcata TaxID=241081 RepID=A0AAN6NLJ3_9PEZI|nr:heterokaryon incompatibility protein-domain-containing protein [Pseudoneurospora amorphoporcata]